MIFSIFATLITFKQLLTFAILDLKIRLSNDISRYFWWTTIH